MPDRRNPHNSYYYKPMDQAAPVYVPPSRSTQRTLPVPQRAGQGDYHYGMPGQASPVYVPGSSEKQRTAGGNPKTASNEESLDALRKRLAALQGAFGKGMA